MKNIDGRDEGFYETKTIGYTHPAAPTNFVAYMNQLWEVMS